jgi:amino acid permease
MVRRAASPPTLGGGALEVPLANPRAKAAVVLLKCQIALGVLAMPTALSAVGGVPGTLVILGIGLLTTWSDYTVGLFKRNHPEVYSLGDVGFVLAGKVGREVASFMYAAFMIAIVGAGLIPIAIAFNAVTSHATCTVAWVVVGAVVCFAVASVQTLNRISLVSWVGFISIMAAIITLTIAVGVQDRPADAPPTGPWDKNITAFKKASFFDGIAAISTAICESVRGRADGSRVLRNADVLLRH